MPLLFSFNLSLSLHYLASPELISEMHAPASTAVIFLFYLILWISSCGSRHRGMPLVFLVCAAILMGRPGRRLNSKADLQQAGSKPLGLVALCGSWRPRIVWRGFEAVGVRKAMFFLSIPVSISLAIPSNSFLSFKVILASKGDAKLM